MPTLDHLKTVMHDKGALRTGEVLKMGIHGEQLRQWVAQGWIERLS